MTPQGRALWVKLLFGVIDHGVHGLGLIVGARGLVQNPHRVANGPIKTDLLQIVGVGIKGVVSKHGRSAMATDFVHHLTVDGLGLYHVLPDLPTFGVLSVLPLPCGQ